MPVIPIVQPAIDSVREGDMPISDADYLAICVQSAQIAAAK